MWFLGFIHLLSRIITTIIISLYVLGMGDGGVYGLRKMCSFRRHRPYWVSSAFYHTRLGYVTTFGDVEKDRFSLCSCIYSFNSGHSSQVSEFSKIKKKINTPQCDLLNSCTNIKTRFLQKRKSFLLWQYLGLT